MAVLLTVGIGGCGGSDGGSGREGGPVRLTYWCAQNPQERLLAERLVGEWNALHPDVPVVVQPLPAGQSSEEVLMAAVAARTTPDICSNIWPGVVPDFVRAGAAVRLNTFADFDSLLQSRIPDEQQALFRYSDGSFYQIPWKTNPIMMLYNERLFDEAGIEEPPRTYSAFLDAAERMKVDATGDGRPDRWIGYRDLRPIWHQRRYDFYPFYIAASGGRTLFQNDQPAIDTGAAVEVFAFFRDIYANGYFPMTTFMTSPILSGSVATEFTGPWQIGWLEANAPDDFRYGFAPLPVPDDHQGPAYTFGDNKNIVIFANSRHPELAWEFAKYLVRREADLLLLEYTKQIPVRAGLLDDSLYAGFFAANPHVRPFAEVAPHTRGEDPVPSLQEVLDAIAQQFEAAAVYGIYDAEEATRRAIERIGMIHRWSR